MSGCCAASRSRSGTYSDLVVEQVAQIAVVASIGAQEGTHMPQAMRVDGIVERPGPVALWESAHTLPSQRCQLLMWASTPTDRFALRKPPRKTKQPEKKWYTNAGERPDDGKKLRTRRTTVIDASGTDGQDTRHKDPYAQHSSYEAKPAQRQCPADIRSIMSGPIVHLNVSRRTFPEP
jgi:hypothetical protein